MLSENIMMVLYALLVAAAAMVGWVVGGQFNSNQMMGAIVGGVAGVAVAWFLYSQS